jgi:hypothetical protein
VVGGLLLVGSWLSGGSDEPETDVLDSTEVNTTSTTTSTSTSTSTTTTTFVLPPLPEFPADFVPITEPEG